MMKLLTRFVNCLFRMKIFPLGIRIISFIFFILLLVIAFSGNVTSLSLERTNLANLIVWAYWWPGIVLAAIFFGRVWCIACPIELLTTLMAKVGAKRKMPDFLLTGWPMAFLYCIVLFVGVEIFEIDHYPVRMALYLVCLVFFSVLTGLIFEKNTFCRCLCPVGRLLGLHARFAPFTWKVKYPDICTQCKDHSCVAKSNTYKIEGRSCGVGLLPSGIDENTECILCGQCLKACAQNNPGIAGRPNPGWTSRRFAEDILELKPIRPSDVFFLLIISGFLLSEFLLEWTGQKAAFMYLPRELQSYVHEVVPDKIIELTVLLIMYPLLLWGIPYIIFKIFQGKMNFGEYMRSAALLLLPLIVISHGCIALLEMNDAMPYIPLALRDPSGVTTAEGILSGVFHPGNPPCDPVFLMILVSALILTASVFGVFLSSKLIKQKVATENNLALSVFHLVPVLYGGILFVSVIMRILL